MYIKSLKIATPTEIIREIIFRDGINLIIDESIGVATGTGNNVGKTTVLKLIDFCLGADQKIIYRDPENRQQDYVFVKDFLIKNEVLITLILKENLKDENSEEIIIEKNFLPRKRNIKKVNGELFPTGEFQQRLSKLLFPEHYSLKPTFRQIISHNIRYKDESLTHTLKTLDRYTSDVEYETLYLYLFGCNFEKGNLKQEILQNIKAENTFKERLEQNQTRTAYEVSLLLVNSRIEELNTIKEKFNLDEDFERKLDKLNNIKYQINKISAQIGKIELRQNLIQEAEQELKNTKTNIDLKELKTIYEQTNIYTDKIQKTFEDLVIFHNNMLDEKIKYIKKESPELASQIREQKIELKNLLSQEEEIALSISKTDSYEKLQETISELNENYRKKGEYENTINQLLKVEGNIKDYEKKLNNIEEELFSNEYEEILKEQLNKFNKHFSSISKILYGEEYAVKYDIIKNKQNQRLYKFSSFNANLSSGKKQGEISCFDIAYTLFADDENIPCLHFLLNDKKELMHDNQLSKIASLVNEKNIQFVASILKDKLPEDLNKEEYFVLKLSQEEKLFKIENKPA